MLPDLPDGVDVGPQCHEAQYVCSGEPLPEGFEYKLGVAGEDGRIADRAVGIVG